MSASTCVIATVVLAGAFATGFVLAQAPPAQQAPPPTGQAPPPEPAAGRGGRQGGQGGARRGGFAQYLRPVASQDVLVRGKGLYDTNCASCHAVDLRGTVDGKNPNLLRSGVALRDQKGELITAAIAKHTPRITLNEADGLAVAEHIHFMHANMGGQGSPGRAMTPAELNVLVGDPKAGEAQFGALCASCHSVTGNLAKIGSKFPDARALQNAWIAGAGGTFGGAGGGDSKVTVTMANGQKLQGTLVRKNEFLVILTLPDGTRRSIARNDGVPKVDVEDPQAGHKAMALKLAFDDPNNKKMYDITAYLWSIK